MPHKKPEARPSPSAPPPSITVRGVLTEESDYTLLFKALLREARRIQSERSSQSDLRSLAAATRGSSECRRYAFPACSGRSRMSTLVVQALLEMIKTKSRSRATARRLASWNLVLRDHTKIE